MKGVKFFIVNENTDKLFADNLKTAADEGVNIVAYDCFVSEDTMEIRDEVKVIL